MHGKQRRHPADGQRVEEDSAFWRAVLFGSSDRRQTDAPQLPRVHNPAALFRMDEDIIATGFIVGEKAWRQRVTG